MFTPAFDEDVFLDADFATSEMVQLEQHVDKRLVLGGWVMTTWKY